MPASYATTQVQLDTHIEVHQLAHIIKPASVRYRIAHVERYGSCEE